jgi:hypothetical protein
LKTQTIDEPDSLTDRVLTPVQSSEISYSGMDGKESYEQSYEGELSGFTSHVDSLTVSSKNDSISDTSSLRSKTSTSMPEVLHCDKCSVEFTGDYRNGNLARHKRLKHLGEQTRVYRCGDIFCTRVFQRQDSRLKHYRRQHPHLAGGVIVLRGGQKSLDMSE